jgi:hypothetical protein
MSYLITTALCLGLTLITGIYSYLVKPTRGWAGMDDVLIRCGIIGTLLSIAFISSLLGLINDAAWKGFHLTGVIILAVPTLIFLIGVGMLIRKML